MCFSYRLENRVLEGGWWGKGRREAFLSGHTYSGLLFFSSSESEFWWWIQLLSPFRVVRTFICLMILLRSSSVGVITRPRGGRGQGRREKGCQEDFSVSRWTTGKSQPAGSTGPPSANDANAEGVFCCFWWKMETSYHPDFRINFLHLPWYITSSAEIHSFFTSFWGLFNINESFSFMKTKDIQWVV